MELLNLVGVVKGFGGGRGPVLEVSAYAQGAGEQVALPGASGCGKTTFLHVVAGILRADSGRVEVAGIELGGLSEPARDRFRAENVGYVFQSFHLMRDYSCLENVLLGMSFGSKGVDRDLAASLLERVGLGHRMRHRASELSVGQQQRVALARALANRPRIVLADEPTGSLDERSGAAALGLLRELCAENGAALLLASHDAGVIGQFERVVDFEVLNAAAAANAGGGGR